MPRYSEAVEQLLGLSAEERLLAIGALWDSIVADVPAESISEREHRVLEARLEDYRRDPAAGIPWDVVRVRLSEIA